MFFTRSDRKQFEAEVRVHIRWIKLELPHAVGIEVYIEAREDYTWKYIVIKWRQPPFASAMVLLEGGLRMKTSGYKIQIIDFGGRRFLFDRRFQDYGAVRNERRRKRDRRSGYDRRSVGNNMEPWDQLERRKGFNEIRKLIPGAETGAES